MRSVLVAAAVLSGGSACAGEPTGPSFSCVNAAADSIVQLVCSDAELAALDRKLARVYADAATAAAKEQSAVLKAEQRGWIKGRDDCWKEKDKRACVRDQYRTRVAELQARFQLVPFNGPVTYVCSGNPHDMVSATFFQTDPPTLLATRGAQSSLMYQQRSASGARYQGQNESLWEHQGEARVVWGYGAVEMLCKKKVAEARDNHDVPLEQRRDRDGPAGHGGAGVGSGLPRRTPQAAFEH